MAGVLAGLMREFRCASTTGMQRAVVLASEGCATERESSNRYIQFLYPGYLDDRSYNNGCKAAHRLSSDGDLDLDSGLERDGGLAVSACAKSGTSARTICLTTSADELRSMRRLWIRISYRSQVLEPSPHGVFRVVCLRTLVGSRTGPLTRRSRSLARLMRSAQTGISMCATMVYGAIEG